MEQKRLTLSEYDAIVAFDRLCFPEDHWTEEDWRELLADERAVYLALLDDGRIVGDVFVYNWQGERDYGKIMNLAVHPAYRGRRLAAGLLRAATELLQAAEYILAGGNERVILCERGIRTFETDSRAKLNAKSEGQAVLGRQ